MALRDVLTEGMKKLNPLNWKDGGASSKEEFWALKDINLEIKQGEKIGIIGRNGAGKSTLLKILSRITEPTTGKVQIKGRVASLLEVGTGFHPELTGRENIFLNGAILGMRKQEIRRKFDEIVDFSGVEKFLDTPVKRYSSGMYVRLAFAVAAHLEPEILLIDEVLAVGDAEFQKKCLGKMDDVAKQGRTVLFVSHNMGAIRQLCDLSIIINNGYASESMEVETCIQKYLATQKENVNKVELATRKDRKGNSDISALKIIAKSVDNDDHIHSGSDMLLSIYYKKNTDFIKNIRFDLGIDNELGLRIGHISTYTINENITDYVKRNENGKIDFLIKKLPLHQGFYRGTICIYNNGVVADWIKNAFSFEVIFGDYYGSMKLPPQNQGNFLFDYEIKNRESL
jgi:lipopolysaccharide transport system ATP-binding protein